MDGNTLVENYFLMCKTEIGAKLAAIVFMLMILLALAIAAIHFGLLDL